MLREYEIFEKFSDGSSLWRAFVYGQFEAQCKIQELSEHSENAFYAIDLRSHKLLPAALRRVNERMLRRKHLMGKIA